MDTVKRVSPTGHDDGHRGRLLVSADLPAPRTSPLRELRRWVRAGLHREHEDCVEKAALVLTELVANAYDHGRSPYGIRVWRSAVVRIEVEDADGEGLPVLGSSRSGGTRGFGLVLVDGLARRWGVDVRRSGKAVWAELV